MPTTVHKEIIMKLNKAKSLMIKLNKDSSQIKLCALSKDMDTILYYINDLLNTST